MDDLEKSRAWRQTEAENMAAVYEKREERERSKSQSHSRSRSRHSEKAKNVILQRLI